ncbi:MAG TPA: gamma-glutamyltransferase [Thermomicrobiales bacterium]|nr:gamma-glutamyltransferase [Thermomicrobiales bacterium]
MVSTSQAGATDAALAASFQQSRSRVIARGGMVAAAHPLAVAAGVDALRKGGNAMDAAIAAALTTTVTLPAMSGLGGDAFFIHFDGKTKEITALNSSGIAPRAFSRDYFISRGYEKMPFYGPLSMGVPGAVDAYFQAIQRWCKLPARDLFSYAIHYAEKGFPLSVTGERTIASAAKELAKFDSSAAIFLRDGRPLRAGEFLTQTNVSKTLREVAEGGPEAFYDGEIAQRIASAIQEAGGELTAADMGGHTSDIYQPISTDYRGYTVYQTTLPTQGHIVLEELNILENADVAGMGHNTAETLHLMIEAKKRAFADRNAYSRDPNFGPTPLDTLISKEFARSRFESIDPERASDREEPGVIPEMDGDTTYLCTADGDGNMVTFIHSLSAGFGSQFVAGDTGVLLNNRVGRGFSLEEGHPNVVEGGKRTMHTLNAYAIARDGEMLVVGGTPGGDQQPQWNMQAISNMIDHGMDVQQAVDAARWQSFPGTDPINLPNDYEVRIESRVGDEAIEGLRARGHTVKVLGPYAAGGAAFIIRRDPETGVLEGGADPRSEGLALGI